MSLGDNFLLIPIYSSLFWRIFEKKIGDKYDMKHRLAALNDIHTVQCYER